MDSKHGEVRKIHVVYFLSRGGHIEHPHMIKVHPAVRNGVRLKDVKRWLSNIRGKDMPNSFSWSYKRRYKTGYVWQDLCDNDLITPICDNEYILKGSEILPTNPDTCKCSAKSPTENLLVEELHSKNQSPQASKLMLKLDLPNRQTNFEDSQNYSEPESYKGIRYLKDGNSFHHNSDESEDNRPIVEYFTKTSGNSPSKSLNSSGEVVKIYRAVRSSSTGMKLDAATQTGESQRFTSNKQRSPPLSDVQDMEKDSFLQKNASSKAPEALQKSSSYSKLSCMRNDVITSVAENNTKHPSKESRHGKPKAMAASNVLRQLFTCGGLETRDSGIRTVKALTFNRSSSNEENRSHRTVDNFQSSTPLKKPQSQPDLTRSLNFSELPSPEAKSISANSDSKISEARLDRSVHSKRDVNGVQNSTKSSPEDLSSLSRSSLSSGEYAAVKLVDIPTADVKNNKENGSLGLHMPVCEVSTEFSVKASPTSAPKSPATHLDDLNDQTKPLSPATDRKGSRKSKASDALSKGKHNNESYCS